MSAGRIQVRATTYRGAPGWLICGADPIGRRVRVFAEDRAQALRIAHHVRTGTEWSFAGTANQTTERTP